ncbi:MAG: carboxypeptidase regulatory-like domain-containing protein [Acidobacteria bacterium]|nr:carboxypeptidase regulatory-like domain-containing protein [Acidobacteriota bacterium]
MQHRILSLLLLAASAFAQTTGTATLVGTLTDKSGAIIPGANISIVNTETQFVYTGQTNAEGGYYIPNLNPGSYRLTVEAQGFKKYVREGITLRTSEQPRIDIQLEVGAVTESVEVTGAPPLLETETTATGQILEGETIVKIPVLQKYVFRVLLYLPSTSNINGQHVVGQRERSLGYTMDGVGGKEPVRSMIATTNAVTSTTIDALQEVKLFTTGMPAEFGHAAGGLLSTVFKSGTNQWHGSAEDRYIQKALIHRTYLEQLPRVNPFTYHELSGTMGGPVYIPKVYNGKDKTFWFFGYQRHHEKGGETANLAVPSPEMLAGNFNFGGLNQIYDPASTAFGANSACTPAGSECWTRLPFANNTVPQARFDPAVKNFLGRNPYTPENNTQRAINAASGPTNNLISPTNYRSYRTRFDAKIDQQFSSQHKMFGRYSQVRHRSWRDRLSPEIAWAEYDWRAVPIPIDQRNIVLSDTYTISPSLINEARFGYNRRRGTVFPSTIGQDWAKQLGIPNVSAETFPNFQSCNNQSNCTGGTTYFRQDNSGLSKSQDVGEDITFQNNVTKVLNRHTLKFGYEMIRTRYNSLVSALPSGTYRFGATDFPFRPNTGNTFAAFLLGSVSNAEFTNAMTTWLPRWTSHAWYIQDDFKFKRNVTLNLGLRWSYESPFNTKYGFQSQFDPNATDAITGRRGAITHPKGPLASKDLNNFQPRLGLAWQVKPNFVFRGAFGLITQDLFTNGLSQNFEEYYATASIQAPPGDPRPVFQLSQGPPAVRFNVAQDGSVPFIGSNFSGRSASWFDPNMKMPYIMNWSGGFQWNFTQNWLLETTYQGSRGVRLLNAWDINQIPLNVSTDQNVLRTIFQANQNYKPYPQFGTIRHYSNYGDNSYHGVTFRTEKRYSHGLVLNAFYTFSKSLNNGDNDGDTSGITFYNRALEKGRANYDIRHRFVSVMTYELPFGQGKRFMNRGGVLNAVLGDWNLAWTQTFQSGPPFTVSFAGSPNNYLPGATRPNLVSGAEPVVDGWNIGPNRFPTQAQVPYLNAAAFDYPAAFTAGTMGRNVLEAPGITWPQFSLSKEWKVYERARFILRWDMNNPFKSPNYGQPDSTFNRQNLANFGRVGTATRGGFSDIGTAQPNHLLVFRLEW